MSRHARAIEPDPPTFALVDAHCHLDHMAGADELPARAQEIGLGICCATVDPKEFVAAQKRFASCPNVCVGVGVHPYWLADGRCDADDVDRLVLALRQTLFVAEIGLDYAGNRAGTRPQQLEAFQTIIRACAEHPRAGRVLSIHAVRAGTDALDIVERYDLAHTATCIFHWFSGTSDELVRARKLGCYFSVNDHMLNGKRGREYARVIPEDRLLLETDAPDVFEEPYSIEEWEGFLHSAVVRMAEIRGRDADALAAHIQETSNRIFAACFGTAEAQSDRKRSRRRRPGTADRDFLAEI